MRRVVGCFITASRGVVGVVPRLAAFGKQRCSGGLPCFEMLLIEILEDQGRHEVDFLVLLTVIVFRPMCARCSAALEAPSCRQVFMIVYSFSMMAAECAGW